jgi:hypothetical protein
MKILLLLMVVAISGCMTIEPYRTISNKICTYETKNDCELYALTTTTTEGGNEYSLNFFEFDDQGYMHNSESKENPKTKDNVLKQIKNTANNSDVLLIVFVHGWHHNASGNPEDSNILQFRKLLANAADDLAGTKEVVGVYVGWRGDSVRFPILDRANLVNTFTFWERKKTSHEIGSQGMTGFLLELENSLLSSGNSRHRMLSIGHSFGAAALYSGINHVLLERFTESRPYGTNSEVRGYGNMIVLLNPAFEGIKHSSLFELTQQNCNSYPSSQMPRLVMISSGADLPNRWAFPTGRRVNAFFETHGATTATHCTPNGKLTLDLETSDTDRYAIGHNRIYITHDLEKNDSFSITDTLSEPLHNFEPQLQTNSVNFGSTTLTTRNITTAYNPILNIWTNGEVMDGHNDIWNEDIAELLYQMILITNIKPNLYHRSQ